MVREGRAATCLISPAAGWASILPGLGEGRRLWESPSMVSAERKGVGSVEWPDSVGNPLFPASKSVA